MKAFFDGEGSLLFMRVGILIVTLLYLTDMFFLVPKYTKCKYDHTPRKRKLMWKGACIGVPFVLLLIGTVLKATVAFDYRDFLILTAMGICAVGDIVIEIRFFKGGLIFFAGHVFYVSALLSFQKGVSVVSVAAYVILAVTGCTLTYIKLSKKYRAFMMGYNLIISGSFALSLPLIYKGEPALMFFGIGACFLAISDWILARNKAYKSTYGWSLLSLMFYFGGQILISAYPYLK